MNDHYWRTYFMDMNGTIWSAQFKSMTKATITEKRRIMEELFQGTKRCTMCIIPEAWYSSKKE